MKTFKQYTKLDERQMSTPQKVAQMQHYWDDLSHMVSDEVKKKKMEMKFGIKNIKLDSRKGKIISFDEDRDYRKEYDNYHAHPEQRERNAARLRARRQMVKAGKVEKFDKKDVHHKDNNPLNNKDDNLAVTTQNWNRTEPRLRNETFKSFVEYFHESRLDDKLDKLVSNEIKKRKLAKFPVNATDDIKMRMKPNKPAFKFPSPNSDMMIHVFLRPMKGKKGMMAFNYQLEDK